MKHYRIGLDIGSTTAKIIAIDAAGEIVFSRYTRHNANVMRVVRTLFKEMKTQCGNCNISMSVSGSVGMGLAEKLQIPFVQEVVAATRLIKEQYPHTSTIIDIGGEDAKIVYFNQDGATDLRMNGNCAGGTGAFIDQMAILLHASIDELNDLALKAERTYPIASRCGVFSKTDVQNLISKNVSREDIAASIFRAIAVQTVVTLSHGCEIVPNVFLCGGPLTFIPALRQAFYNYLALPETAFTTAENANLITAWGAALSSEQPPQTTLTEFIKLLKTDGVYAERQTPGSGLTPIFKTVQEYENWKAEKALTPLEKADLKPHTAYAYLGIDSGSTTTKIVVVDEQERLLFSFYAPNEGNPIAAVKKGLAELEKKCLENNLNLLIKSSCSTGYGEDLIKAAFNLDHGIIETIAHYLSAKKVNPQVSFILDIGGQDMKALFMENGVLNRMEINEACSSGCGSFIETFANSLRYSVADFAKEACLSQQPADLGTRCTVFMNSKVKQVLREGATVADIAAGLSYSVVKNCLYKVLKLRNEADLGKHIVVQGGTMRNDSIVRALELLVGQKVYRSNFPELMGAYGCALYARFSHTLTRATPLSELAHPADYTTKPLQCKGCENQCLVHQYTFGSGNIYYSGNKCEKAFTNAGGETLKGINVYAEKYNLLFNRANTAPPGAPRVGLARALNMYEAYPFWHALFNACGIETVLSDPSTFNNYENGVHSVMSDNICFPAKLAHSHIYNLLDKKVDRIFLPYVIYEKLEGKNAVNSYNCPIVSGYSDVIRSVMSKSVPIDSPAFSFKDKPLLEKACRAYLKTWNISERVITEALHTALNAQRQYEEQIQKLNQTVYAAGREAGQITILLAGRPYHTDPLIQHKISDMIAALGANVITEDMVRNNDEIDVSDCHLVTQWAYINRILKSAKWAALQDGDVHFMQLTSFGCGPDAFLLDEVKGILNRHGKTLTLLKIDDVNNIGSLKLRVRSVLESLKFNKPVRHQTEPFLTTRQFARQDRGRKILIPFINEYLTPFLIALFKRAGYEAEVLPQSDLESAEYGLKYANNEVCYPATLVVGDIIKALKSGKYDPAHTAVAISQTGGQCRASNYISLIKRAVIEAGYRDVPVISIGFGGGVTNDQPGLKINWPTLLPATFNAILYSDCIAKFYHAAVVREDFPGRARALKEKYLSLGQQAVSQNKSRLLLSLTTQAAEEFNTIILEGKNVPKVGVVGEIFLKFNAFANKDVVQWLCDKQIEVVPPTLLNFFLQAFVNTKVNEENFLQKKTVSSFITGGLYRLARIQVEKFNKAALAFRYYTPFDDVFEEAARGQQAVSLLAQFGEGWLLPAEIISFAKNQVNNVISLQPFGCIANHVVAKGVEKKIKTLYPGMNLLSLDFDSGVSDVNITNRLLLFTNNLQ